MPGFEGGWICPNCWTANRHSDLTCYRCDQLAPGVREVATSPKQSTALRLRAVRSRLLSKARHVANPLVAIGRRVGGTTGRVVDALIGVCQALGSVLSIAMRSGLATSRRGFAVAHRGAVRAARAVNRASDSVALGLHRAGRGLAKLAIGARQTTSRLGSRLFHTAMRGALRLGQRAN